MATLSTRRVASIAAWRDWKERQTAAATGLRTVRSTWLELGLGLGLGLGVRR